MKLWLTTIENKYFVKILWYLLGEYVKTTILLVCSIYTVHHFFYFLFLFFPNHQFVLFFYRIVALFIQRFSLFIYSFILVSHFVFFFFSFLFLSFSLWLTTFGLFNMYCSLFFFFFPSHRFVLFFLQNFCTIHTVFSLFIYRSVLVSHFVFFFFSFLFFFFLFFLF